MIAEVVDQIGQATRSPVTETGQPAIEDSENSNASNVVRAAEPEEQASSEVGAEVPCAVQSSAENPDDQVLPQGNKDNDAAQRDLAEDVKKTKQLSHRIHGTALPR